MTELIGTYRNLDRHILLLIYAEGALQLINAAFFLVLPIYMTNEGYTDADTAGIIKYRFAAVLVLAFPFGLLIKGRKITHWFYLSVILMPTMSFLILETIESHELILTNIIASVWGLALMLFQVTVLPYILRNTAKENHSAAISLSFSTWSFATIFGGILVAGLQWYDPKLFSEKLVIQILCGMASLGILFLLMIRHKEVVPPVKKSFDIRAFDWDRVMVAIIPNILIAVGAGMTIPFISLFFNQVYGVNSSGFALIAMGATIIVFFAIVLVPYIKTRFGYAKAIPGTQAMAIIMLAGLACTEFFQFHALALPLAIIFYILRQPLMNMAAPMTSEFTMEFVGKRNEEIMSALNASIWSGSWFFSGWFFEKMRSMNVDYVYIFLITVGLYTLAVGSYVLLIQRFNREQKAI